MEPKMNKRRDDRMLTAGLHPLDIDALVEARHPDPFSKLGMHQTDAGPVVRALLPDATARHGDFDAPTAQRSAS